MQVELNPDLENFVTHKVNAGEYASASDVINNALSELREQDALDEFTAEYRDYLQHAIDEGIAQADRGDFVEVDLEKIKAAGRKTLADERDRL